MGGGSNPVAPTNPSPYLAREGRGTVAFDGSHTRALRPREDPTLTSPATLSIVVPVYDEEAALPHSHEELLRSTTASSFRDLEWIEIIYVDDGSTDNTASVLRQLAEASGSVRVKVLQFSRNFGHSAAVFAGLDAASGDTVAIIDADLQDPPALLADMYDELKTGYDVVYGQRRKRGGDSVFKRSTDNSGTDAINQPLSERRAQAIVDELVKDGIDASALTARGYGSSRPVADNATPEGRARNRRVEFRKP